MEKLGHLIEKAIVNGSWKPLFLSRRGSALSHIFFTNDLMLFCEASRDQAVVVISILETFYYFSRKKVNKSKLQVFFSPNTPSLVTMVICDSVGFNQMDDLRCYLGIPLFHNRVSVHTFNFVVKKVRQKLSGWDARKLSLEGQITLVRSVLLAIPS
ncbi:hypothetical protein PVK06_034324 [Gossypium arboreum]|uniref:Uncharacterized protein n=1 Tax=Gossypium arboreum TaxID=29729 RepID=A0ABR0NG01_GOSAR|nr:hypothetical protein PVK06_034324 [Gossypium arboreum]